MTKKELRKRIEELEREVAELKARPVYLPFPYEPQPAPYISPNPFPGYTITCETTATGGGDPVWLTANVFDGPHHTY